MKPRYFRALCGACCLFLLIGCHSSRKTSQTSGSGSIRSSVKLTRNVPAVSIATGNTDANELVTYAESLAGTHYRYGGNSPKEGFDCSGFVWYVFRQFNVKVPRRSVDFTNAGTAVAIDEAKRGDLILFTGSNPNSGEVGHLGIVVANKNNHVSFIHSASGGGKGVMVSGMTEYFITRFVKVLRIF